MTFSIAGRCAETGMLGLAITTSSICVGSRCPWVRAGVGAVATQNITLPSLGPAILDALAGGEPAPAALDRALSGPVAAEYRQVTVVDGRGRVAHFSGRHTLGTHNVAVGEGCVAAGNLLTDADVPSAMVAAFAAAPSGQHLAARLLDSLEAGQAAGGEEGPVHSAALLVADKHPWPLVDLRVDWDEHDPIAVLRRLWLAYEPQMNDYQTRAVDPATAPSYGVPGDE